MCLALVALDAHAKYRCVIAANRDEFHARAAEPAHWWDEGVLAGRDTVAGGTWFGVTRTGRWALITNFREGIPRDPYAPSRGELVTRVLRDDASPLRSSAALLPDGGRYHGFNLLVGDDRGAAFASNRASSYQVYVMDADGGNVRLVANTDGRATAPQWSRDGRAIYFPLCRNVDYGYDCEIFAARLDAGD